MIEEEPDVWLYEFLAKFKTACKDMGGEFTEDLLEPGGTCKIGDVELRYVPGIVTIRIEEGEEDKVLIMLSERFIDIGYDEENKELGLVLKPRERCLAIGLDSDGKLLIREEREDRCKIEPG